MILVDNKQLKPEEVGQMFNIPVETVKKYAEFKINENLKGYDLGSRKKRDTQERLFPAVFFAEDKSGVNREIRYASRKSQVKDRDGRVTDKFAPRKVKIDGDITVVNELSLALFLYINPKSKNSPFRDQGPVMWEYEFVDRQAVAKQNVGRGESMKSALNHASASKGPDLKLLAKGMGLQNLDSMTELEIQAELTNLALQNPQEYIDKAGKQTTKMDGRIIHAIDKGIFKFDQSFGTPKYLWAMGPNKGQLICEVTNQSITPELYLQNFIKANLDKFYTQLLAILDNVNVEEQAEAFLAKQTETRTVVEVDYTKPLESFEDATEQEEEILSEEFFEDEKITGEEEPLFENTNPNPEPPFPKVGDFKSSMAYLAYYKGSNPSNKHGKDLMDAIKDEGLQPSTIREWVQKNIGY